MNNLTARIQARRLAEVLITRAKENEPPVTAALQNIAVEVSAELADLENKFKTEESLTRKLLLLAEKDESRQTAEQKLEKFARRNNDALRYTFISPNEKYAQSFHETIERLKEAGFEIPPNRIWNAWKTAETSRDMGYRGINITVISSQNQNSSYNFTRRKVFAIKPKLIIFTRN